MLFCRGDDAVRNERELSFQRGNARILARNLVRLFVNDAILVCKELIEAVVVLSLLAKLLRVAGLDFVHLYHVPLGFIVQRGLQLLDLGMKVIGLAAGHCGMRQREGHGRRGEYSRRLESVRGRLDAKETQFRRHRGGVNEMRRRSQGR